MLSDRFEDNAGSPGKELYGAKISLGRVMTDRVEPTYRCVGIVLTKFDSVCSLLQCQIEVLGIMLDRSFWVAVFEILVGDRFGDSLRCDSSPWDQAMYGRDWELHMNLVGLLLYRIGASQRL